MSRNNLTMKPDELNESFRLWLASPRARAHRVSAVRWFAQDVAAGVVWLNDTDPQVTRARGRAMAAFFLDPLGYRTDALVRHAASQAGFTRAQIKRGLKAIR